ILAAEEVLIMVNGHNKSRALRQAIEEGVNHMWTISALQLHRKGIIVSDEAACAEIKVGTYRYFKDIEQKYLDSEKLMAELYARVGK
ncbi:MAG: glucosamine-6-phosphate deaminase, partial [Fusobacteriaceae bacterium]